MTGSPADGPVPLLQLTLPSDETALEAARLALFAFIADQGLAPSVVFKLELVLEETLMNLIRHAFPEGGLHPIDLTVRLDPEIIELRFEDDGLPFDPLQVPLPVFPTSVEEARPGGLGLVLVRNATSAWRYERVGQRNRLTLQVARV